MRVAGQRPARAAKVASDFVATIHVAFTDGHPRETATSRLTHATSPDRRFEPEACIGAPPFAPGDADLVWDVAPTGHRAWVHDVAVDAAGLPRIVYAVFHSPTDHRYRHARWTGTAWQDRELTPAGSFFPEDGGEKQYSGGIVFDDANPAVVYLAPGRGAVADRTLGDH